MCCSSRSNRSPLSSVWELKRLFCLVLPRFFPFGVDMFAGSATIFFAYIGFDSVASTAEEEDFPAPSDTNPIVASSRFVSSLRVDLHSSPVEISSDMPASADGETMEEEVEDVAAVSKKDVHIAQLEEENRTIRAENQQGIDSLIPPPPSKRKNVLLYSPHEINIMMQENAIAATRHSLQVMKQAGFLNSDGDKATT
ncbi:Cationic amino acid transporter 2, vacuolar [Platanthera guangdongensis]|uniref:Cationic amino acid transporter 2, vacuolar n=1 Tax=Platanthera guangdongensis TaxID=2320717 RepID=A0ABR2M5S6_9ASPA